MFQVVADYPMSAAFGGDYLTRCAKGQITEIDPATGREFLRDERIITTGRYSEFEGDICLGEKTVRHLAHLLGMVDGWRVERLREVHEATVIELTRMSDLNARLIGENAALREKIDRPDTERVYIAADGTTHASRRVAEEASRAAVRLPRAGTEQLRPIAADEAPAPEVREVAR